MTLASASSRKFVPGYVRSVSRRRCRSVLAVRPNPCSAYRHLVRAGSRDRPKTVPSPHEHPHRRDTIVIGASLGGPAALRDLVAQLPPDLAASVLIVQHQAPSASDALMIMLRTRASLPVKMAEDGEPIVERQVYVARPDHHLLVSEDDRLIVTRGPRENRSRPAVNPLFRSAAVHRSSRTIGVVLTGALDDGVAGLAAIKRCGGVTVVQDPREAFAPDMPRNAIEEVSVDHILPLSEMGAILTSLVGAPVPFVEVDADLRIEARLAEPTPMPPVAMDTIGTPASVSCPECGGPIWRVVREGATTYRCYLGHVASPRAMLIGQSAEVERSLWVAIRALQDRATTLRNLSRDSETRGRMQSAQDFGERADETEKHVQQARSFLVELASRDASSEGDSP